MVENRRALTGRSSPLNLAGDPGAKKVAGLLNRRQQSSVRLVTPTTAVPEMTETLLREGAEQSTIQQVIIRFIASGTKIYPCDAELAYRAGELNFEQKKKAKGWGILDSINYTVVFVLGCASVTGEILLSRVSTGISSSFCTSRGEYTAMYQSSWTPHRLCVD
jgi:hypothetical protein